MADEILLGAALGGADLRDLAGLAAEILARSRPADPDGKDEVFQDGTVRLETTFDGAGMLTRDLSPQCTAVVQSVLDSLSAPAGAEDTRSYAQRYHDALHEAMRRLGFCIVICVTSASDRVWPGRAGMWVSSRRRYAEIPSTPILGAAVAAWPAVARSGPMSC